MSAPAGGKMHEIIRPVISLSRLLQRLILYNFAEYRAGYINKSSERVGQMGETDDGMGDANCGEITVGQGLILATQAGCRGPLSPSLATSRFTEYRWTDPAFLTGPIPPPFHSKLRKTTQN